MTAITLRCELCDTPVDDDPRPGCCWAGKPPVDGWVGSVLVANGWALCVRCTTAVSGDDVGEWADWHAGRGCLNYTGTKCRSNRPHHRHGGRCRGTATASTGSDAEPAPVSVTAALPLTENDPAAVASSAGSRPSGGSI